MFLHLKAARPLGGYRIEVRFDDGRQGIADLAEALKGPVFEPLQDPDAFRDFRIDKELRTIVWPNGDRSDNRLFSLHFFQRKKGSLLRGIALSESGRAVT